MKNYTETPYWGLFSILVCYLIWGFFPLYWIPLLEHPPAQLLAHRILWGAVFALLAVAALGKWRELLSALRTRRVLLVFLFCAGLLAVNWLTYLLTITTHQVLQASLGYFIAPLVSIFCGRLFLGETLRRAQGVAIAFAAVGVVWLAVLGGQMPWLAVMIALTWGIYGLARKLAPLPALLGFTVETLLLLPLTLLAFLLWGINGTLVFAALPALPMALLVGSGLVTMVPLLFFASGARRVRLSTLGILQYLTPTLQFLVGLLVFKEAFDMNRFIGYVWVWIGVAVFIISSVRHSAIATRPADGGGKSGRAARR